MPAPKTSTERPHRRHAGRCIRGRGRPGARRGSLAARPLDHDDGAVVRELAAGEGPAVVHHRQRELACGELAPLREDGVETLLAP